jgi:5'-3' exonuclease
MNTAFFSVFYKIIREAGFQTISHSSLEADDVVYLLTQLITKKLHEEDNNACKIIIITNDSDYLQMKASHIELYNMTGKCGTDLTTRSLGSPSIDLQMKICIGDISDNIPPICNGIGKATAEKLARMSDEDRNIWINNKGEACLQRYKMNREIISFEYIPTVLQDNFHNKIQLSFI